MSRDRTLALLLLVLAGMATVLVGCAPPEERGKNGSEQSERDPTDAVPSQVTVRNGGERPDPSVREEVVLESFRGGLLVPRCPGCGEVFREGTTTCVACGVDVAPWRAVTACGHCESTGVCRRCGHERPCLACAGDGVCVTCDGRRTTEAKACGDCGGKRRCLACGGDGMRTVHDGDFLLTETALPGICPTCIGGSGRCADCGGGGRVEGGATCVTCDGGGTCADCRGTGTCAHDRGDGLCVVCGGSGREVVNGPPLLPGDRIWNVVRVDDAPVLGRVTRLPEPDVHLRTEGEGETLLVLVPDQVEPLSYYLACRDHTSLESAAGRVALAEHAERFGFLPLALVELRRAAADRRLETKLVGRTRAIESALVGTWRAAATNALASGDRHTAVSLGQLAATTANDENGAATARAFVRSVRTEADAEEASLSPADRARRDAARRDRVARTVSRAKRLLDRATSRRRAAEETALATSAVRSAYAEADRAAWAAERIVGADAAWFVVGRVAWPEEPAALIAKARSIRAEIALSRAATEIRNGRFEYGARLARRALDLTPGDTHAKALLREAQLGIAHTGVERTPQGNDDE